MNQSSGNSSQGSPSKSLMWSPSSPYETVPPDKLSEARSSLLKNVLLSKNLIVLIGSGPSIDAGGPSMTDLWANISGLDGFEVVKKTINYTKKAGTSLDDKEIHDIELFLSLCSLAEQLGVSIAPESNVTISSLVESAEKIISASCRGFVKNEEVQLASYRKLLQRIVPRRNDWPRSKIFTTNYDLCIESAAASLAMPYIDGFSLSSPRSFNGRWFDVDYVKRGQELGAPAYLEAVFLLHKLHGSVDWETLDHGIIRNANAARPSLIYPCSEKYAQSYGQPYLEMISRFQAALREPDTCLLVLGFGFNDLHLNEIIFNALRINNAFAMVIYDHNIEGKLKDSTRKAWASIDKVRLAGGPVRYIQDNFSDFVDAFPAFSDARSENDVSFRIAKALSDLSRPPLNRRAADE